MGASQNAGATNFGGKKMSRLFSGRCGSVSRMFAYRAKKETGQERKR